MNLAFRYFCIFLCFVSCISEPKKQVLAPVVEISLPDTTLIPHNKTGNEIRYGLKLFTQTAYYLGPEGKVLKMANNKMNCKNCHLDNGLRPMSNSLVASYLKYPQYRAREGTVLTIEDRINNCFERPMNGKMLPYDSREMRALVAYMRWLCEGQTVTYKEDSLHLGTINLLDRAASISNGSKVYTEKCQRCHGADGHGQLTPDKITYVYPPLWGQYSYAQGSSMHRVISAARFVKWSMPYLDHKTPPQLTDEQVFDVVAFINCDSIHPRPYRDLAKDCPDLPNKPIDFPAGPYFDSFPVSQHRLGPFKPIKAFYENLYKTHPELKN